MPSLLASTHRIIPRYTKIGGPIRVFSINCRFSLSSSFHSPISHPALAAPRPTTSRPTHAYTATITMAARNRRKNGMEDPMQTSYSSNDVEVPADFLRSEPYDAQPITWKQIDFKESPLPEYAGGYAVVLDNVLSHSECAALQRLAEASVRPQDKGPNGDPWQPALVNVGGGFEVLVSDYRNSDRIIWDQQEVVDRMWERIVRGAPEVAERLRTFRDSELLGARRNNGLGARWDFDSVNCRMRFLRYGAGQFFRPHCDGPYQPDTPDDTVLRTHFTVHMYLNDSAEEVGADASDLQGGATSFLSSNEERRLPVHPRAGRVLIFQHRRLYHSGDDVKAGLKYTVRTDILYKLIRDEDKDGN